MPSSSDDEPSTPDSVVDSAVTFRDAAADAGSTVRTAWRSVQHWVEARGRLSELILGGVVAMLLEEIAGKSAAIWSFVSASVPALSKAQLLALLVVIAFVQTAMQTYKFKNIESIMGNMTTSPETTTDGGRNAHSENEEGFTSTELVRLVVLGYAVIGAMIGSSYGVGGAVFGATVGAVFGDELMKSGP
jgi:hypothetical protein